MLAGLQLAKLLLALAGAVMKYLNNKTLIDAGMAKAILQGIRSATDAVNDAIRAARYVRHDPNSPYAKRLREKYTLGGGPSEK